MTRTDLTRLGLDHLLGTPLLRAYMHGFFIDARLYSKAAAAAQPAAYEAWRASKVAAKLEEERQGRISVARKLPKVGGVACWRLSSRGGQCLELDVDPGRCVAGGRVAALGAPLVSLTLGACVTLTHTAPQVNREVAARLMAQQQLAGGGDDETAAAAAETASKMRKAAAAAEAAAAAASTLLSDDRFKALFEDTDFAIDEHSTEYKLLHPNVAAAGGGRKSAAGAGEEEEEEEEGGGGADVLLKEHFQQILEEGVSDEDDGSEGNLSDGDGSDGEGDGRQQQQQQRRVKGHWQQLKRQQPDTGQAKPAKR